MGSDLRDVLRDAERNNAAVGHFNIGDIAILKAVIKAAEGLKAPVIVGASEGERTYLGTREIGAMISILRDTTDVPIFLNADHTHSLESAMEAAKAGFDSAVFDLSALPIEENARQTRVAVQALRQVNEAFFVEGEIGDIGTGSEIHETAAEAGTLTTPEEGRSFVAETGIDALAPAIGNRHGMSKTMVEGSARKHLAVARIAEIKQAAKCFMTLHGGSGTADQDFTAAIRAGINIVHVNTELRIAWRRGLEQGLNAHKDEVVPYKILPAAIDAVAAIATDCIRLFSGRR